MLDVVQFQRRPGAGMFSVERLFDDVRSKMPPDIRITVRINRFISRGVVGRISDALVAWRNRGTVNHILGDVHYLAWLLPRKRTVLTILDCGSLERMRGLRRWLFWFFWYWWPVKKAAHVTVISEFSRRALRCWVRYPAEQIHVIPPPLSDEFSRAPFSRCAVRPRLLQPGTRSNKNLPRLIEALDKLPVTLVLIGTLEDALCERMSQLGIDYENHVDLSRQQLVEQYRQADIVVFPSTYEGFGLPIIEAQAVGRPVLTSNVCAMPEAAGGAACLVDPFDVADIRRGIRRLLDDPTYAQELVERGFENVARYAPERIAHQYAAIYRTIHAAQGGHS